MKGEPGTLNPCPKCGSVDLEINICPDDDLGNPSQYWRVECRCGHVGPESWYMKDCGLEGLDDIELATLYWNDHS